MSNQTLTVSILGWVFLIASWVWPNSKWGGRVTKLMLTSFSLGLFVANAIYALIKP